jgi:hypothetical protein
MNASYITDKERYSDMMVLQSGAGYYIGTLYSNPEGYVEPGGRDSVEYYPTKELAEFAFSNNAWTQRNGP